MDARQREQKLLNAVGRLAESGDGLFFLRWLLDESGLLGASQIPPDLAHAGYREGRREMGWRVMDLIQKAKLPAEQAADILQGDFYG